MENERAARLLRGEKSGAALFEENLGGLDSFVFGKIAAFILDADVAVVVVGKDDLEGLHIVGFGFVPVFVEVVGLGGDPLGVGHEFLDALVAVIVVEVPEIRERAAVVEADVLQDLGHPGSVRGKSAVVFHDDIDVVIGGEGREGGEAFHAIGGLFVIGGSFAVRVYANRVATEEFRGLDPALVIVDRFLAFFLGCFADVAFAIDHDEDVGHAEIGNAFVQFTEVFFVLGLVLEKLIDVFEGVDAVVFLGIFRPFHVGHLAGSEGVVVGPLGERYLEKVLRFLDVVTAVVVGEGGKGEGGEGRVDEGTAFHWVSFRVDGGEIKRKLPLPMTITTKRGDEGFTDLLFGGKIGKTEAQVEALGAVDELNAALGMARVVMTGEGAETVDQLQGWLVTLMGELAMPAGKEAEYDKAGFGRIGRDEIAAVEKWSGELERQRKFKGWLRPGQEGGELAARLHVARTVARRVERRVWEAPSTVASTDLRIFLNRISDLLWLMASRSGE